MLWAAMKTGTDTDKVLFTVDVTLAKHLLGIREADRGTGEPASSTFGTDLRAWNVQSLPIFSNTSENVCPLGTTVVGRPRNSDRNYYKGSRTSGPGTTGISDIPNGSDIHEAVLAGMLLRVIGVRCRLEKAGMRSPGRRGAQEKSLL